MLSNKKIDTREKVGFSFASALLILVILSASSLSYLKIKKRIISDIDGSLLVGAASIKNFLPEDFHDKATSSKAVTPEDDKQNMMALSEYANRVNFKFLYTLKRIDKKIYITSSSATAEELAKNEQVRYFTPFNEADPSFHSAFEDYTPISFTHTDRWGTFRALAIPEKSPGGNIYLSVAELDISYLKRTFQAVLLETIFIYLLLILGALPLYYMASRRLRRIVEERQLLFQLIDNADSIAVSKDPDLRYLNVNQAYLTLTGHKSVGEIVGKTDAELFQGIATNEQIREYMDNDRRALRLPAGESITIEECLAGDDGVERFFLTKKFPIYSKASGDLLSVSTLSTEITERKRAEETLRESERRFQKMLGVVPDMISIHSPEMEILYSNWQGFGAVPEGNRLTNTKCYKTYRGFDEICPDCRAHKVMKSGEPIHEETRLPDGTWVDLRVIPLLNQDNEVEMFMEWLRDITVSKMVEETLRESEKRFSTAFQNSPAPLVLSEIDTGLLIDVNDRWVEMLAFSREESIGKTSKELGIWDDPSDRARIVGILRSSGRFKDEPIRFKTKYGKTVIVLWSAETINLSGKQAMLSMITDITQLRQAEEERERLGTQLQQAQKMEAVGRLAGGVAHDFNNMLGVILGHADMILEEMTPDSPFYDDLMEIRKAGARSADLTRKLLGFARKQTVAPKVIDLNKTVEGMLKMLQRLIGEDIEMAWIPCGNTWRVKIDPVQIDQILANLCVNARDAIAGVGKVTIEIGNIIFDKAYCRDNAGFIPGEYVMLAVSDNGCGMDIETQSHLFEPFFTTKDLGKGTGLGMATVYGVVKQNKGFINVYSEPGQGTTFKIYLPRHKTNTAPVSEEMADKPSKRGHETVLLVEDESAILKITTMMLKRQGYTVMGASTPGEAIRLATEHAGEIHLLMTDVVMPEMNGRDMAGNILSLYPGLKCLFMSGYTANVIAHHGVLDEGVNFIQKPFSRSNLVVKVREVLDQK